MTKPPVNFGNDKLSRAMRPSPIFEQMEAMRSDGWCVVLKCLPKEMGFIIEGSRSEYDAPCPDKEVGKGKWLCETQDMRHLRKGNSPYRNGAWAFGDTADQAVDKAYQQVKP